MTLFRIADCRLQIGPKAIFTAALALGVLVVPPDAEAQPAGRVYRIGYLSSGSPAAAAYLRGAFQDGLHDLGWVEGRNILIEYRWAEGSADRLPVLAAELVRLKVDLIVVSSTPGALAAKSATREIPIVFQMVSDPVASGLVASLAHPGGNVTGWSNILPKMSGKLLQLLTEAVPGASRMAILWSPANPGKALEFKEMQAAARLLGVTLQSVEVPAPKDLEAAFSSMTRGRPDALITLADQVTQSHPQRIVEFAARSRLPAIYQVRQFVDAGGLMSYGFDSVRQYRRTGFYVDKILKGATPADLPVEQPTEFELVINLKAAKALGLTLPQSLLNRADEVIQ
jgi:putative ABC transport system substrate-binding protein